LRRFGYGEGQVLRWAEEGLIEIVGEGPTFAGDFDGLEIFLEVNEQGLGGWVCCTERDCLGAVRSVGLGIECAKKVA
jgi:hypothetical protein